MKGHVIRLKMSAKEHSQVGWHLYSLLYDTLGSRQHRELRDLLPCIYMPHNGGSHNLTITGYRDELICWVELFEELTELNLDQIKQELSITDSISVSGYQVMPHLF